MFKTCLVFFVKYRGSLIFILLAFAWVVSSHWDRVYMKTIVSDRADTDTRFWQVNEGYSIQVGRFSIPVAQITFWKTAAVNAELFLEFQKIEKVIQTKWLANRSAIFLHLDVSDFEPGPGGETKIIYDFDSGQLMVFSEARLWRTRLGLEKIHWSTKEEFEQHYRFLDSEKQKLIDELNIRRKTETQ